MRILVIGFEPFANVVDNPSGLLARQLEREGLPNHDLTVRVLPVSFRRADEEIRRLLRTGEFDLALLLGVASTATSFRLESQAINEDRARIPDCDGESPQSEPCAPKGPESLRTPLDLDSLHAALSALQLPVEISHSAGRYVCNRAYYAALHEIAESRLATRCLFLHVPPDETTFGPEPRDPFLPFADQQRLVGRLLDALLAE